MGSTDALRRGPASLSPARALLFGAVTVGALDLADAIVFFGLRGVTPTQILHSIASGLLGRAAYGGGVPTAALGLFLHFFIALGIVTTFFVVSRRVPVLARYPFVYGPAYGVVAYFVMNLVVVPLSRAVTGPQTWPVVVNGLLIHALGVGLPSALFARAAQPLRAQ